MGGNVPPTQATGARQDLPQLAGTPRELPPPSVPQIPRSYLSLQEAVLAEQQRRSLDDDVQYLTDRQLEQLVEQTPDNDIKDYEDLQSGGWGWGGQQGAREKWNYLYFSLALSNE